MYALLGLFEWNIPLLIVLMLIASIYILLVGSDKKLGMRIQPTLFFLGVGLFYLIMGSPLYAFSHLSFSTHMIQMSLLYFIVPPLVLLSIPRTLVQKLNASNILPSVIALITFSILFFLYHLPKALPFLYQYAELHAGFIFFLFFLSFMMWLPITMLNPENKNSRKRYAMWSGILLMPACLLFIINGLVDAGNLSSSINGLVLKLCISAEQMNTLLPFQINTKIDQIVGGLIMIGIHKFGLMMVFQLSNKSMGDIKEAMRG